MPIPSEVSFFFAHPFTPAKTEWIKNLSLEIKDRFGAEIHLPAEEATGGVLFCKLCHQIRSSTAIVSEITDLNRNVLFEHGFAIALGRRSVLVRQKGIVRESELDVISDLERNEYDNREEVLEYIGRLYPENLNLEFADSGEPKILGKWDMTPYEPIGTRVAFLKIGQQKTDGLRRIEKILRRSGLEIDPIDADEHTTHMLHSYCVRLRQSKYVVGHFVRDDRNDHESQNALVALLLGIALGLGREVIILQEGPVTKPMIDLKGVIHKYETEAQAQSIVEHALKPWRSAAATYKSAAASRSVALMTKKAAISIGGSIAESDELLGECFLPTEAFEWAKNGSRFLITGPRGAGKTAIFKTVLETLSDNVHTRVISIEPTEIEMTYVQNLSRLEYPDQSPELVLRSTWRLCLLSEIAFRIIEAAGPGAQYDQQFIDLKEYLSESGLDKEMDLGERFVGFIKALGSSSDPTQERLKVLEARLPRLRKLLEPLLADIEVRLFIDNLDRAWNEGETVISKCVAAIVQECFNLEHEFPGRIKPVLFLRKDILDALRREGADPDKWKPGEIKWTRPRLRELLETRLEVGLTKAGTMPVGIAWEALLPAHMYGQEGIAYVIDRCLLRPRDCMNTLQHIISESGGGTSGIATVADVEAALRASSKDRLINAAREYRSSLPDLEPVVRQLVDHLPSNAQATSGLVHDVMNQMSDSVQHNWIQQEDVLKGLFEMSVICFVGEEESLIEVGRYDFRQASDAGQRETRVSVVPRFKFFPFIFMRQIEWSEHRIALHPSYRHLREFDHDPVRYC